MSETKESPILFRSLFKRPRLLIATAVMYLGTALMFFGATKQDITPVLREYGVSALGVLLVAFAAAFMWGEIRKRRFEYTERVSSVDERRRHSIEMMELTDLKRELRNIKASSQIDYSKIESILTQSANAKAHRKEEMYENFASYFDGLREMLENKSADADEKASILLDKGTAYSKFGIFIFILSIIGWQLIAFQTGFKDQYIYGIASCSVLFIFIEFLSAWFLRQYRSYVETSTYLVKIKSIFDKYMLAYLALKDSDIVADGLTDTLSDEIVWPDSNIGKRAKNSLQKEVLDAFTYIAKSAKKEVKND